MYNVTRRYNLKHKTSNLIYLIMQNAAFRTVYNYMYINHSFYTDHLLSPAGKMVGYIRATPQTRKFIYPKQ